MICLQSGQERQAAIRFWFVGSWFISGAEKQRKSQAEEKYNPSHWFIN
jgi:hypothetical protein